MEGITEYDGYKITEGSVTKVTDPLTVESALQMNINGESFTVVMQTPGNEKELAVGLMFAENIVSDFTLVDWGFKKNKSGVIEEIDIDTPSDNLADGYLSSRSLLSVSSCGICGKKEIEDLLPREKALEQKTTLNLQDMLELQNTMLTNQPIFNATGGSHGIAIFDQNKELLSLKEDIGRHNALDKAVGELILQNKLNEAKYVSFSGRISYEIVSKCFRAKIPVIIAFSSPSSLAIDFAKEYGMTLIGFCRKNKATCYAGSWRVKGISSSDI
jgi:FdhD protein